MSEHSHILSTARRRIASLFVAVAVPGALLVAPGAANAQTFTVSPGSASSLQSALNQAAAHANAGGTDVVSVPAGTYTGNFTYMGDAVDVEGAGPAKTKLTAASGTTFQLNSGPGVFGLKIENSLHGFGGVALRLLDGGVVRNVELDATGDNVTALYPSGSTSFGPGRIVVGKTNTATQTNCAGNCYVGVSNTSVVGRAGESAGLEADANATVAVSHLRSVGVSFPLTAAPGGVLTASDSLIVMPKGASGISALNAGGLWGPNSSATLTADRVTVVGDPTASQQGVSATAPDAGKNVNVMVYDSVLAGLTTPLGCSGGGGKGYVSADWSNLPSSADSSSGAGCTVQRSNPVAGNPVFVDPEAGDYHLRYNSPLIDAGDPVALTPSQDLDGQPRPVGGRVDLGAFEYQRRPPIASIDATPVSPSTGQTISFTASASDADPGDSPLTYTWKFDDGSAAAGKGATHAFATAGFHVAQVRVTDPTGKSVTAQRTVTVVPDHTPPTLTLLVKPRLLLAKTLRHGMRVTIGCSEACTYRATLLLTARTAKALHMKRRGPIGQRSIGLATANQRTITITLTRRARSALHKLASVKVIVRATATDHAANISPPHVRHTTLHRR